MRMSGSRSYPWNVMTADAPRKAERGAHSQIGEKLMALNFRSHLRRTIAG